MARRPFRKPFVTAAEMRAMAEVLRYEAALLLGEGRVAEGHHYLRALIRTQERISLCVQYEKQVKENA